MDETNKTQNPEIIRVMIVDDHQIVRYGLNTFLQGFDDLDLVGEASNGEEALKLVEENYPDVDVILMDMVMPGMNGVEATRAIISKYPDVQIIALTSFTDEDMVQDALEAGAISFLHKDILIDELVEAIRKAHAGHRSLSPEATDALISIATRPPKPDFELTPRELEVLAHMVTYLTNREIADELMISVATVRTHVSNILSKLRVSNRHEAVAVAVEHGLVND